MGLSLRHQLLLNRTIGVAVALTVILALSIRYVRTQNAKLRVSQTTTELLRLREAAAPTATTLWSDLVDTSRYEWALTGQTDTSSSGITVDGETGIGHMPLTYTDGTPSAILTLTPAVGSIPPPTPLRPWVLSAIFTLLVVAGSGWILDRRHAEPLEHLAIALRRIASGDHDVTLDRSQGGIEYRVMRESIQKISNELFKRIRKGARGKRHLSTILDNMSEGVLAIKADHTLMLANGRARLMLSMPLPTDPDEDESVRNIPNEAICRNLLQCIKDGFEQQTKCHIDRDHGTTFLELNTQPLRDVDHTVIGAICVLRDVSVRHQNEQMRRNFVANVSHELKTPLTAITGAADTILQDEAITLDESRSFVEKIEKHARHLAELINDVLELSRLQGGNPNLETESLSVAALVSDVVDIVSDEAESRRIQLTCKVSEDAASTTRGDRRALSLAIENIVVNAIRYTDPGGSVNVHVSSPTGEIRVAISDSGCGIPHDDTERIFERFYRVDAARSRETGGTGLGLAIAKNAVAAHEGLIRVESKLGQGTTFTIILPAVR